MIIEFNKIRGGGGGGVGGGRRWPDAELLSGAPNDGIFEGPFYQGSELAQIDYGMTEEPETSLGLKD